MNNSLTLLAQPHSMAVSAMIQEALKSGVNAMYLSSGQSVIRPDGDADLPVFIRGDAYNDPTWPYRGSVNLRYKRIDLGQAFGSLGLRFFVGAYYTAENVVAQLAAILNVQFDPTDYIHETIPLTTSGRIVTLRATTDSPRWKGNVDIFVYR
jgi:hypothetical protein